MKKIHNIIESELIVRTNNHKLRQEYGEVGTSTNITAEGTSTIFTTKAEIRQVNYITVNGVNLIEGVHYVLSTRNTIRISNSGAPVRKNPSITTTILVSYYAGSLRNDAIRIAPVVNFFKLNKESGKNTELLFDFSITPNDGKNIFWSVIREGNKVPLYSGSSLYTVNGVSTTGSTSTVLKHFITEQDFLTREGQDIPFTLVVVYDLTEDASYLDEKVMATAVYHINNKESITGFISLSRDTITTVSKFTELVASYNINATSDSASVFDWAIHRSVSGAKSTVVRQGNQASPLLTGTIAETVASVAGDNFDIRYSIIITEFGTDPRTLSNDRVIVNVPTASLKANAGYLDASIMSYVDTSDNLRKKIGSLGTAKDLVEYNTRVPRSIFTQEVLKSALETQEFISAPVNTFVGTVSMVYFVIEIPDNWGPVNFYQTLGLVDPTAFNRISLGNGYTAYLYKIAPSDVENPSDYYIKPRT